MQDQIHEIAQKWAQAIESRFPENVLKFYHPDGSLWGTFARKVRPGHEEIKEYFDELCKLENLRCEFKDGFIRIYKDFAFYSGSYEFSWTESGNPEYRPARFSFVYKKENDNWLIIEHHSSLFPE